MSKLSGLAARLPVVFRAVRIGANAPCCDCPIRLATMATMRSQWYNGTQCALELSAHPVQRAPRLMQG